MSLPDDSKAAFLRKRTIEQIAAATGKQDSGGTIARIFDC
jgi:hypothetical protein